MDPTVRAGDGSVPSWSSRVTPAFLDRIGAFRPAEVLLTYFLFSFVNFVPSNDRLYINPV